MSAGENIRKRRVELDMSQQQLADALGYKTRSSIAKIEKADSDITNSKLVSFANVLQTTVGFLLTGVSEQEDNRNVVVSKEAIMPTATTVSTVTSAVGEQYESILSGTQHPFGSNNGKVVAVVLAGGKSTRNHQNTPNQFINIKGKPVINYVLDAYQRHPAIDSIYIVCLSGWESIIPAYARQYGVTKLAGIIPAGATGALSIVAAVEWLSIKCSYNDTVIFQEATRPMVTEEMISNAIRCTQENGSAVTFEPMDEYLQFMKNDTLGVEYIDRTKLLAIQSPEGYDFGRIHRTIVQAKKIQHAFDETCCAMLMYNLGKRLVFVEGNRYNIKIVRQEDIGMFEALMRV